ncbi:MAG: PhnD/SsuA/transferrin family substrate-binding protein [Opitutae bacterium]|nr:PhnD/SsuA/transferrin family substrate-binding protein [Opitutae bacterium]
MHALPHSTVPAAPPRRGRAVALTDGWQRWLAQLLLAAVLWMPAMAAETAGPAPMLSIGFSSSMFSEVNENDAKAAVKVWGQTVARTEGIQVEPDPKIIQGMPALLQAVRNHTVDMLSLSIKEYILLRHETQFSPIFVAYIDGKISEEYVLLVHREGRIKTLADLRGRTLSLQQNVRTTLATEWLDTLLIQNGLRPAHEFCGSINPYPKLSKAVLPVFFRQSDACIVTQGGYYTMCELNPQIGRQLQVLASSPKIVPAVLCFRADYKPEFRNRVFNALRTLHQNPAGQQVLSVFQSERLVDQPESILQESIDLFERYRRLTAAANAANTSPSP